MTEREQEMFIKYIKEQIWLLMDKWSGKEK